MEADDLIKSFKDDNFDYKAYSERLKNENSELKLKIKELETTKPVNVDLADVGQQRELLKDFLEHIESTIDYLPCEKSELIDDYFNSL